MTDTFEYEGHEFTVKVRADIDMSAPWIEDDGHGIVSDWTSRAKRPGERVLVSDRHSRRYYDIQATLQIAKRDDWGVNGGPKDGESIAAYAARAVEADFDHLQAWCEGRWHWVYVTVRSVEYPDLRESLGGIESEPASYLEDVQKELAEQLLETIEARRAVELANEYGIGI